MEMVAESKILVVYQTCDKCGEGIMERDGNEVFASYPPLYPHKCDKCGYKTNYHVSYPYQRIVPIEVLREPVGREITG